MNNIDEVKEFLLGYDKKVWNIPHLTIIPFIERWHREQMLKAFDVSAAKASVCYSPSMFDRMRKDMEESCGGAK